MEDVPVAFSGDDKQPLKERKDANRARMKEGICMYVYIVEETLTLAVLCFKTFPN